MNAKQHPPTVALPLRGRAPRHRSLGRIAVNMLADGLISGLAALVARFLAAPHDGLLHPLWFVMGGAITLLVSGLPFRIPQQYWRFSGIADLRGIAAASLSGATLFVLMLWLTGFPLPSPTFPVIHVLVLLVGLGGVRLLARLCATLRLQVQGQQLQVLLVGSDLSADLFMRALERMSDRHYAVLGLVTRSPGQQGRRLHGVPILGGASDIGLVIDDMVQRGVELDTVIVTDPEWRGSQLSGLLDAGQRHGIAVQRTPSLTSLTPAAEIQMRPIALEDLLNRPEVALDREGMTRLIHGQVVLVTGAGGTIGSELVRQVAQFGPERILLLDHGEFALWQIDLELSELFPNIRRDVIVANIRDTQRVDEIFAIHKPELVFHAAALKHVPIVEANPCEGILTNVIGTRIVADAAIRHTARAMVLISSDKAVNPSSIMGATKRCAEIYCQALAATAEARGSAFRCVTVRFGNVLGSTGSVVPLFRRQLEQGGPLTVTHPDMTRYFMTVPEAVGLVLQASVRGTALRRDADETDRRLQQGGIFVLDMGEPVRILDLARQVICLAGLKPDEDVAIRFTGLRPGEKLFEELFHGREAPVPTDAPGLKMATPRLIDLGAATAMLQKLETVSMRDEVSQALGCIQDLVPEFVHNPLGEVRCGPVPKASESQGDVP